MFSMAVVDCYAAVQNNFIKGSHLAKGEVLSHCLPGRDNMFLPSCLWFIASYLTCCCYSDAKCHRRSLRMFTRAALPYETITGIGHSREYCHPYLFFLFFVRVSIMAGWYDVWISGVAGFTHLPHAAERLACNINVTCEARPGQVRTVTTRQVILQGQQLKDETCGCLCCCLL